MSKDDSVTKKDLEELEKRITTSVGEIVSEALQMISERFDKVDARFESVDARFDRIDARLDERDEAIADVRDSTNRIERKLDDHSLRLKRLEQRTA